MSGRIVHVHARLEVGEVIPKGEILFKIDDQNYRATHAEARASGYMAALLTQHRPNVFTQKVANIDPGRQIDINLTYYHLLPYRDGVSFRRGTLLAAGVHAARRCGPLSAAP